MSRKSNPTEYTEEEAQRRFEAALRGARIAGPKHNESLTPKRVRAQPKKRPTLKRAYRKISTSRFAYFRGQNCHLRTRLGAPVCGRGARTLSTTKPRSSGKSI
jgi:hypothetical protein